MSQKRQNNRQLYKIIKNIDTLYDSNIHMIMKKASPNDRKYLAAIIKEQKGGDLNTDQSLVDLNLIASGNREIKQIVKNLKATTKSLIEELNLTKQENKILKEQIRNLEKGVNKLDKTKCKEKLKQAQKYIEQFLQVRKAIIGLVAFIKKKILIQSTKLSFLSKPPLEYEDDLEMIQKIQIKKPTCENVQGIIDELEEYQNPDILNRIMTDYESISSSVRVIVRIFTSQNLGAGSVMKEGNQVVRTQNPCVKNNTEVVPFRFRYGPFYQVFQQVNNKTIYDSGFQLNQGNKYAIFGYGHSGSGKSKTLLGDSSELGMLQMILKDIKDKDLKVTVKESYGRIEPPTLISKTKYINKIESKMISHGEIMVKYIKQINEFLKQIHDKRKQNGQIKFTPNNPNSSRGHLIIQVESKSTKFVMFDLAGSEDPFVIAPTLLRIDPLALKAITKKDIKMILTDITNPNLKIRSTFWNQEIIDDFVNKTKTNMDIIPMEPRPGNKMKIKITQNENKQVNQIMNKLFLFYFKNVLFKDHFSQIFDVFKINKFVDYVWNMLTEGFFINETLNHLKIYLQREGDKNVQIIPARSLKIPKGIVHKTITATEMKIGADQTRYSPERLLINPDTNKTVFDLIKTLDKFQATNFLMVANVRDDLNKIQCTGTSSTLDFAHQVKS